MGIIGPKFRKQAGSIINTLKNMDASRVAQMKESGSIDIEVDGEKISLEPESVEIIKEVTSAGRTVDVLEVSDVMAVILR
jgi:valyl-tRNA synthetase